MVYCWSVITPYQFFPHLGGICCSRCDVLVDILFFSIELGGKSLIQEEGGL